jgi:hypothetical protein
VCLCAPRQLARLSHHGRSRSTFGRTLADELGAAFYEGDEYHSSANRGTELPWSKSLFSGLALPADSHSLARSQDE